MIKNYEGKRIFVEGTSQSFSASRKAYRFFSPLGLPMGDKTISKSLIPYWILHSSEKEKAEFLGAWMGSDANIISPDKYFRVSFNPIRLSFNRLVKDKKTSLKFADQVKRLFKDIGIYVTISQYKGNIRKNGHKTMKFVVTVLKNTENMITFLEKVGYRYCGKKEAEGMKWLSYLKYKREIIRKRHEQRARMREMHHKGKSFYQIAKDLSFPYYQAKWWAKYNDKPSVPHGIPDFKEWIASRYQKGLICEKIILCNKATPEEVFDISVDKVHNFVANGCIVHNCHMFLPSEGQTAASEALHTLVKQGREPGISLVMITQRPNKLHEDALSQADLVISHRLTSKADMEALRGIMQTYMLEDIQELLGSLPRQKGTAIILDDNSERIFTIQVRPRLSWHAGGSPSALKTKGLFE